jgi:hypothetical protein
VRLGSGQELVHAERAAEARGVGPPSSLDEFGEQPLELDERSAERARAEGEEREEDARGVRVACVGRAVTRP